MPNSLINTSQSIIFFLFFFFLGVCVREEGGKEWKEMEAEMERDGGREMG